MVVADFRASNGVRVIINDELCPAFESEENQKSLQRTGDVIAWIYESTAEEEEPA